MTKVIIIDDEPLAISIIEEYLKGYMDLQILQVCNNGFEGVKAIMQHQPDLIFLDIQMPKINGFEMLELLDQLPSVIFTTAYDEYAMKAFETNAIDYLLKPFSKDRFDKAIQKWLSRQVSSTTGLLTNELLESISKHPDDLQRIVVKTGNQIKIIPNHDIIYLEAYDDYVKIYTSDGFFLKKKTMNYFEDSLDPVHFVRVHRSYIIHLSQLTGIQPFEKDSYVAILKTGNKIPLSKTGYTKIKSSLGL